jgi:peptidoglycan L-alanyl-D-glutamate endopeptidase CwlK
LIHLIKSSQRVSAMIGELIPEAQMPALKVIATLADQGLGVRITFAWRSRKTQFALYAQGRGPLDQINAARLAAGLAPITEAENARVITNAPPGKSWHEWRRAIDVVPVDLATAPDLSDPDNPVWDSPHWDAIGYVGKLFGFEWGGDWPATKIDRPHLQWTAGADLAQLNAKYPEGLG